MDLLEGARIHAFVPVLAHRFARERLNALAQAEELTDEVVRAAEVVITMGCGDACPIYPGKRYEDWELEDPAGKDLDTVRRIRDQIEDRVRGLVEDIAPERGPS